MAKILTAGRWFLQVISALEASNIDCQSLCLKVGIEYSKLKEVDGRIDIDLAFEFWQALSEQCQDEQIGLKLAKNIDVAGFKALGFSLLTSDTVKEAIERLVRYQKIMGDAGLLTLESHPNHYSLVVNLRGNRRVAPHQPIDATFTSLLNIIGWILKKPIIPQKVYLKRTAPNDATDYEMAFHCLPEFSQPRNEILFSINTLEASLPNADRSLARVHDQATEQELQAIMAGGLSDKVRKIVLRKLSSGEVKLEDILPYLPLAKRTLQRQLKEEGYTFFQLVDEIRKNKAKEYVANTMLSFEEVAFLLGFSEHANFSRAFKRWFNCTPGQYRNQQSEKT